MGGGEVISLREVWSEGIRKLGTGHWSWQNCQVGPLFTVYC